SGKTSGTGMAAAAAAGVPVALVAGQVSGGLAGEEPAPDGVPARVAVMALKDLADGTAAALASPRRWLRQAARQLAARVLAQRADPPSVDGLAWSACVRSPCSAEVPTPSWPPRSARSWASPCFRCVCAGSATTAMEFSWRPPTCDVTRS